MNALPDNDLSCASVRAPKIVLDGVFFQFRDNSGIARVWTSLLRQWSDSPFGQSLVVLDRDGAVPKFDGIGAYVSYKTYYSRGAAAETFLLEDVCRQYGADLFLSTHLTSPLETPSVMLVHDLIPELFGHDETWLREKRYCTYHASGYLAVSNHTLCDLHKVYPFSRQRPCCVAHNGVAGDFCPVEAQSVEEFRKRFALEKPYFLVVGSRAEHKNIQLFHQAFSRLPNKEKYSIVCCGGGLELEAEVSTQLQGVQIRLLNLSDAELNTAYNGAVCLVFPSKYEGFGLPILEAMASGCPVITCSNASIPEVAGAAALYVDDSNPEDLLRALIEIQSAEVRKNLIHAGKVQASQFAWDKSAQTMADFVRTVRQSQAPEQLASSNRLWRDLRSYQCQPQSQAEAMKKFESAWFTSVEERARAKSAGLFKRCKLL